MGIVGVCVVDMGETAKHIYYIYEGIANLSNMDVNIPKGTLIGKLEIERGILSNKQS